MNARFYTVSKIAEICHGALFSHHPANPEIRDLLIDSRRLVHPEYCLFVALVSERNDGHKYIEELYQKGVRNFMVSEVPLSLSAHSSSHASGSHSLSTHSSDRQFPGAAFIQVPDTLSALQQLGAFHRRQFTVPVIGITGSNGKTSVKEWLFQLLSSDFRIIRSPKSYNSQIGVPLSVWKMAPEHNLAIFEAGISRPGEMEKLAPVIHPTLGIFTNIGHAHDEYFEGQRQKVEEKLKLFAGVQTLIYCSDNDLITACLLEGNAYRHLKTFTWGRNQDAGLRIGAIEKENGKTQIKANYAAGEIEIIIPFADEASIENAIHCLSALIVLGQPFSGTPFTPARYTSRFTSLTPLALRLELREAINHCSLINDSYNSDINSLTIALDFLKQQNQQRKKTIILSDLLQTGRDKNELYRDIGNLLATRHIDRIIGIGRDIVKQADKFAMQKAFFTTTDEFLHQFPVSSFQNETILLKGARIFEFERIGQALQQKSHETVLEINLDALVHNLNHYRSLLDTGTRVMAMVKAFSYGSGSFEIANVLQFHHVDYLAVAYADEGVELRKAGIRLPVMVMSPEEESLDTLLKYNLEPEIYNLHILNLLEGAVARNQTSVQQEVRIHIKLDTGMHRLGFDSEELEHLIVRLKKNPDLRVQSVFSHLAASEDPEEDEFTRKQIALFAEMSARIARALDYPVLLHILNSAGTSRFPEAQFDMVRLGIGLYGVGSNPLEQSMLRNVSTLKSVITQIKHIPAGETIGYNRKGKAVDDTVIAIVPIGYADGLNRRLGNGRGKLYVNGKPAPIIGNICMDLTMIDITDIAGEEARNEDRTLKNGNRTKTGSVVAEGTGVVVFDDNHPVTELAGATGTIPYEALTGISRRVRRIYYYE